MFNAGVKVTVFADGYRLIDKFGVMALNRGGSCQFSMISSSEIT